MTTTEKLEDKVMLNNSAAYKYENPFKFHL